MITCRRDGPSFWGYFAKSYSTEGSKADRICRQKAITSQGFGTTRYRSRNTATRQFPRQSSNLTIVTQVHTGWYPNLFGRGGDQGQDAAQGGQATPIFKHEHADVRGRLGTAHLKSRAVANPAYSVSASRTSALFRSTTDGFSHRIPKSHRYEVNAAGLRIALFFSRTYGTSLASQTRRDHARRPLRSEER